MKKNVPVQALGFFRAITTCSVKFLQTTSLLFILFLVAGRASAQDIKPEALRQIEALRAEKASRTDAQKKIDSHLLLAFKMQNDKSLKLALPDLRTDLVKVNAQGKVKVEITAAVSPKLLNDLRSLGSEVLFSSARFANILANIPLHKVEQIASLAAVKHIGIWIAPMINDELPAYKESNDTVPEKADFKTRAGNVTKEFSKVFGKNGDGLNTNASGSVASEADVTHKANLARSVFGVTGSGVKIGVISNGVDGYATSQASGDLPPVINILPGQAGTGSEGRAMMELIYDIAPGASLYFATAYSTQGAFAQNILDLRAAGCDIIVDDISYYAEGVFQDDSVAKAVNTVTASGALYFSSAGNSGNKNDGSAGVWEGDFVGGGTIPAVLTGAGDANNFGGGVSYETVTANTGYMVLKWSDPLGQSANDYDIYVTNSAGTAIYDAGDDSQDGNDNPFEIMGACAVNERIYVFKFSGAARALHLNSNRGRLNITTPGVMYGHNAAASTWTVAATPAANAYTGIAGSPTGPYPNAFNSGNTVEIFSSDGPRRMFYNPDGSAITPGNILFSTNGGVLLQKPDITAADGVSTATPGFSPFFGTSAAAPNAAAIAALIKSKFPSATREQIRTALVSSAIDIEAPGVDRDAGAGIVMAYEALVAAGATAIAIVPSTPVTISAENAVPPNNAPDPGETLTVNLPLMNIGTTNTTDLVATLLATGGITNPGSAQDYGVVVAGGPAVSRPFTFTASGNCGDNITLTLALQDGATDLGTISYTLKLGTDGTPGAPQTFANTTPILIPGTGTGASTGAPANPYPSNITVSGLSGKISKVTVGIKQFNHTWPGDVDLLLVSPTGQKMIIMSDAFENTADAINVNLVLDDAAVSLLPPTTGIASGTFKPTNYNSGDVFPSPAPAGPYQSPASAGSATLNGTFGGQNPNGTWSLYVVDDASGDAGNFNGGWEINITTVAPVCSEVPLGPTASVLSVNGAASICNGSSANLKVDITGGTGPYTVVYSDGTNQFTVNNYTSGADIPVSPTTTTTYSLVSVTDANSVTGTGNSGTPTIAVTNPTTWYADVDGDGYGDNNTTISSCDQPANYVADNTDCNDNNAAVHPNATEICDGIDNNCDGQVDEGFPFITYYYDGDGDGYGTPNLFIGVKCQIPDNYVTNNQDCNDNDASVHPGAAEICGNGIDDNCDGRIDEGCNVNVNVRIAIADKAKKEGNGQNTMPFAVTLNKKPTQTVQVAYATQNGTATAGSDYIAQTGTLTFAPGVKRQTINITIKGDRRREPDETFKVLLSNPVNAVFADGTAVGTLINDDGNTAAFSSQLTTEATPTNADRTVTISPNPAQSKVYVTLKGYTGNVTIQLQSVDGKILREEKLQAASVKFAQQLLNVSGLANGIYFIRIMDEKGSPHTEKLVIQH